jgi:uncharacterized protein YdaU (DUF1376 family)
MKMCFVVTHFWIHTKKKIENEKIQKNISKNIQKKSKKYNRSEKMTGMLKKRTKLFEKVKKMQNVEI